MCNGLNLCAIFWEGDLINGTGTHKRKVTRNTTPEAQECCCRGAALRWCRLAAALCWTLLLRLGINIWRIIAAVIALGAICSVAVVITRNENGAGVSNKRAELPKSCMRLGCGKVKNLSADLRVRAGGITGCLGIDEWARATRCHAKQPHRGGRVNAESFAEELARLLRIRKADANHRATTADCWHEARIFSGRQDHVGAGWWLFKGLEQRVLRIFVHEVGAFDERNSAAPFNGEEGEASGEGADLVDLDRIGHASRGDDNEVGVAP